MPPLKDLKIATNYDFRYWAKERDTVLKRVQEIILKTR